MSRVCIPNSFRAFHGTAHEFERFERGRGAIYFTTDRIPAQIYAQHCLGDSHPVVIEVDLDLKNPLVLDEQWFVDHADDDDGRDWCVLDNVLFEAAARGHDGAFLRGVYDFAGIDDLDRRLTGAYDQVVVFQPSQIRIVAKHPVPASTVRFEGPVRVDGQTADAHSPAAGNEPVPMAMKG